MKARLLLLALLAPLSATGASAAKAPFTIRDIQFDHPQIGVALPASFQIFTEFERIFSILGFGTGPFAARFHAWHPLEQPQVCALFGQYDKNRPGLAFTFAQHRGESPSGLDRPDQSRHFEVGGQAGDYAASFSIEFESKP